MIQKNIKGITPYFTIKLFLVFFANFFINAAHASDATTMPHTAGTSGQYVNDVVTITFYLPSGTLSTFTCPTSATSSTPVAVATSQTIYDQNLASYTQYGGYTCNMLVSHFANQTLAAYLTSIQVPSSAPGGPCPTALYGAPTNMYCYQGTLSAINAHTPNASACYNDFTASSGCTGIPVVGTTNQYVGAYYVYNSVVSSGIYLSAGSTNVTLPSCSAGSPLLLSLPAASNFGLTYTRNVTFEISSDGYQSLPGTCTCNAHSSPAGNSPANSTCTASSLSLGPGFKNQVTINANSPSNFLTASTATPWLWLSSPVCTIGAIVQSTPITP